MTLAIAGSAIALTSLSIFGGIPTSLAPDFLEQPPRSSLTGEEGVDGPVLVVKIDDTAMAHPQVGLSEADVVYIEQVEGGLTRLAAVYSSKIPQLIGPVRSARISDIELFAQYGKVAFSYSGAQRKLLPVIASANLFDVGANRYGPQFYFNEPTRIAPYAMMLRAPEILLEASTRGVTPAIAQFMGWRFGSAPEDLIPVSTVEVKWPAARYSITWSSIEERWLLSHNGRSNLDNTGFNLGPKTFVIQMVSITDSEYKDKVGGVTPFSATVGYGSCYLLRDGGYIPCLWSRPTSEAGTTFTDLQGAELTFAKGQVWFALADKEPLFDGRDAAIGATK